MAELEKAQEALRTAPRVRRVGSLLLLIGVGWLDYATPLITLVPFYIAVLLAIALFEPVGLCLLFAGVASLLYVGVTLLSPEVTAALKYPYWEAIAHWFSFSLIAVTTALLVGERRQLHVYEKALAEVAQNAAAKQRAVEQAREERDRLQHDLAGADRQFAAAVAIAETTSDLERPVISLTIYAKELLETVRGHEQIPPVVKTLATELADGVRTVASGGRSFPGTPDAVRWGNPVVRKTPPALGYAWCGNLSTPARNAATVPPANPILSPTLNHPHDMGSGPPHRSS